MSADVFFPLLLGVACIVICLACWREGEFLPGVFFLAFGGFLLWSAHDNTLPEVQAQKAAKEAAKAAQEQANQQPHVVREADGCKVYAFKSGDRWHFFTRCPNATTVTDTAYEECTGSGKSRRCEEKHDSIETK